jgi:CheY-like chemotaxis protein
VAPALSSLSIQSDPGGTPVRLRILRRPTRPVLGFDLEHLMPGTIRDIGVQLAGVLLSEGWAEPVPHSIVLIVDDDADVRVAFAALLRLDGYTVVLARHGREGLERLAEWRPDVIVLDLDMPVMDGWQFRAEQEQLADKTLAAVPVLIVSASADTARHAAELKATAFIEKPCDADRLLTAVSTAVHGAVA